LIVVSSVVVPVFEITLPGYDGRAWASHGGRWTSLGRVPLDRKGRCLIIAEGPELATPPDRIPVTLEPSDVRLGPGAVPTRPPILG
jgi:hypothetical protein